MRKLLGSLLLTASPLS